MHAKSALAILILAAPLPAAAQEFQAGQPLGAVNEAGERMEMSENVTVFGSFHFSESCTFDPNRNLILAMSEPTRSLPMSRKAKSCARNTRPNQAATVS